MINGNFFQTTIPFPSHFLSTIPIPVPIPTNLVYASRFHGISMGPWEFPYRAHLYF